MLSHFAARKVEMRHGNSKGLAMSKKNKASKTTDKRLIDVVLADYDNDLRSIELLHDEFDEKEKILFGEVNDSISKTETSSSVQDPTLLSSIIKQNNAVMAQMPSGKVRALSQKNRGKSLLMDLILHEHVLPHATTQYDVFTKLWLLSLYRKVYGSFGVLVDNVVNAGSGYIGPDFTLIPIRAIIPQAGKFTIEDSERVTIRSKVTKDWLKSRDKSVWKNIDNLIESKPSEDDPDQQTYIQRKYAQDLEQKGEWEIITRYEKDRWVTFSKDQRMILRDIPNPQKNSELPVVMCHSYPLLDRFIGLGEFERGKTLHYAMSSLINLYMDGVKMSIFPPLKIDPNSVADWDSFQLGAGATWLMKTGQLGGIEQMQLSPLGLNTFQSTYGFLKAGMLTLTNTTDTGVSAETDPGFGKTPQALKMQAMTEGQRTQFDRRMLELATEKIFDKMIDIVAKRQEQPMELYLYEEDLRRVEEVAPDVVEMFETGDMGKVTIKPSDIKNCEYRYEIDAGSTVKKDEIIENQTLSELIGLIMKLPGAMEQIQAGGVMSLGDKQIDFGELLKRWIISSGITDWDKIVTENAQEGANFEDPALMAQFQQMGLPPMGQGQPMPQGQPMQQGAQIQDPAIAQVLAELEQMGRG